MLDLEALDSQELPDEEWHAIIIKTSQLIKDDSSLGWCSSSLDKGRFRHLCFRVENHYGPHIGSLVTDIDPRMIWYD